MTGSFSDRLLAWWDLHGRKNLPWQHPRTPYRVWISEIMLQQTQVTTVIPYFEKWMQDFPDIQQLAHSSLDEVLSHWAGLGYYARARNLHRCAQICVDQHAGELPVSSAELVEMPGIGLSTANAIISQSTDQPAAILDGNVRRVLSRHAMVDGWTGAKPVQDILWREAESRLPNSRGADYTQAIMDLGATLCHRRKPDCERCPVIADCKATAAGTTDLYPAAKPKTKVKDRKIFMLLLSNEKREILLERRPPTGIWGGLWSLPQADDLAGLEQISGMNLAESQHLPEREHRLSHIRMQIQPVLVRSMQAEQVKCSAEQNWVTAERQAELGLPKPVAELLKELNTGAYS